MEKLCAQRCGFRKNWPFSGTARFLRIVEFILCVNRAFGACNPISWISALSGFISSWKAFRVPPSSIGISWAELLGRHSFAGCLATPVEFARSRMPRSLGCATTERAAHNCNSCAPPTRATCLQLFACRKPYAAGAWRPRAAGLLSRKIKLMHNTTHKQQQPHKRKKRTKILFNAVPSCTLQAIHNRTARRGTDLILLPDCI